MSSGKQAAGITRLTSSPLVTGLAISLLLVPFVLPFWLVGIAWWPEIADLAHFLAFGLIALLILEACLRHQRQSGIEKQGIPLACYLIAAVCTLVFALSTELIQFFLKNRTGSVSDALHNFGGAACALLCVAALRKHLSAIPRYCAIAVALVLFIAPILPIWVEYVRLQEKETRLPLLFGFDEQWENEALRTYYVERLSKNDLQPLDGHTHFYRFPDNRWSSLFLDRGWRHWGAYSALSLTLNVASELNAGNETKGEPLKLYLYFTRDQWQQKRLRAEAHFTVTAGAQSINIPFGSILYEGSPLDMKDAHILRVSLVKSSSANPLVLSLDELRLL